MLGNDVIDLIDVDARPESFRPRFEARVFTVAERAAIASDPRDTRLRWAHWAAKEAAYKLLRQADPRFVFSPGKLVARFEAGRESAAGFVRRGRVALDPAVVTPATTGLADAIETKSFETDDFVHVVALRAETDWQSVAFAVAPRTEPGEDASLAVRRLALREIARELGVAPSRLAIGRRAASAGRRDRVPTLELDGETTHRSLSLSHHGRFVAFAMAPRGRDVLRAPGSVGYSDACSDGRRRTG